MNLNDAERAKEELEFAIATGDPQALAKTAVFHLWPLYSAHSELLVSVIETLPSPELDRYPALRLLHRMTPVMARTTRPFKPLVLAEDTQGMTGDEIDLLLLVQMIAFRVSGDVASALAYAERILDRISQPRGDLRMRTDGPLWYFYHQIGSTYLAAGDTRRALLHLSTSRQLGRCAIQPDAERLALGRTALAHAVRGSIADAERTLADATALPVVTSAHVNSATMTERVAAALIGVERLSPDVDEQLDTLELFDSVEMTWPFALLARTRTLLARRDGDAALELIRLAADGHHVQAGSFASDVITSTSIEALLTIGDTAAAHAIASSAPAGGTLTAMTRIRLAIAEGRHDAAERGIGEVTRDPSSGPAVHAEASLLAAWVELARTGGLQGETLRLVVLTGTNANNRRMLASAPRQLIDHVRAAAAPDAGFDATVAGLSHVDVKQRPRLTPGELRVLQALWSYPTTAAMAAAFHVSPNTIKSQLKSLYRKLDCTTREEATRIATQLRLLPADLLAPSAAGGSRKGPA